MWVNRETYEQLVKRAAQYELLAESLAQALVRVEEAEKALQGERAAKDWLVIELTSRFVTKQGTYGLGHEPPQKLQPHPRGYIREPTDVDTAKLEYYKQCARNAGVSEEDAIQKWEAEMRGESIPIEYDAEQ